MITLSVIIPVYNEESTVGELLRRVIAVKLPADIKKEIVVVDDGSSDKTSKVLSEFEIKKLKFKIIRHKKNLGKGAAVRTGVKNSTGDLMLIQDADLEYDPDDYSKLLVPFFKKNASVVYGSRLINYPLRFWGKNKTILPFHLIANKFLTGLTNLLYGSNLTDMETCFKVFKKEIIRQLDLKSDKFDIEPEITAKILKKGITIAEVPVKVSPRTYKEGKKIGLADGFIAIWTLLKYRFHD